METPIETIFNTLPTLPQLAPEQLTATLAMPDASLVWQPSGQLSPVGESVFAMQSLFGSELKPSETQLTNATTQLRASEQIIDGVWRVADPPTNIFATNTDQLQLTPQKSQELKAWGIDPNMALKACQTALNLAQKLLIQNPEVNQKYQEDPEPMHQFVDSVAGIILLINRLLEMASPPIKPSSEIIPGFLNALQTKTHLPETDPHLNSLALHDRAEIIAALHTVSVAWQPQITELSPTLSLPEPQKLLEASTTTISQVTTPDFATLPALTEGIGQLVPLLLPALTD